MSRISSGAGLPVTGLAMVALSVAFIPVASNPPAYHSMPVLPESMNVAMYFFVVLSNPAYPIPLYGWPATLPASIIWM